MLLSKGELLQTSGRTVTNQGRTAGEGKVWKGRSVTNSYNQTHVKQPPEAQKMAA